jgi:hypothetical protein
MAKAVKGTVTDWLNGLATDVYEERITRLVQSVDRYPNCNGDYTEK